MGQEDGVLTVYFQRMERYFLLRNRTVTLIGERAGSSPNLQSILAGLRILKRQEYDNVLSTISSPCAPGDALLQCKLITPDQVLGQPLGVALGELREDALGLLLAGAGQVGARAVFRQFQNMS